MCFKFKYRTPFNRSNIIPSRIVQRLSLNGFISLQWSISQFLRKIHLVLFGNQCYNNKPVFDMLWKWAHNLRNKIYLKCSWCPQIIFFYVSSQKFFYDKALGISIDYKLSKFYPRIIAYPKYFVKIILILDDTFLFENR